MHKFLISCIGDSLTEGDYGIFGKSGIANVHDENYPYFLSKLANCEVKNFGFCGYTSCLILDKFNQGIIDVTGSDIIIILLGTNGGQTEDGNSENDLAYKEILNRCKNQSSAAKIYLCTPPHCSENPKWSNCGLMTRVVPAAKFIRKLSKELNLPLIDLLANDTFRAETEEIYQNNDGLHFNKEGS